MKPDLANTAIDAVRRDHAYGHVCTDGKWYNPHAGTRSPCPTLTHLNTAWAQLQRLAGSVHDAAHQPRHVDAVASGLLAGTPLTDLPPEEQDGWRVMARQAIEALAWSLENSDALTNRATSIAERI